MIQRINQRQLQLNLGMLYETFHKKVLNQIKQNLKNQIK